VFLALYNGHQLIRNLCQKRKGINERRKTSGVYIIINQQDRRVKQGKRKEKKRKEKKRKEK